MDVADWLPKLGLEQYEPACRANVLAGPGRTLRGPADALATAILDNAYRL